MRRRITLDVEVATECEFRNLLDALHETCPEGTTVLFSDPGGAFPQKFLFGETQDKETDK